MAVKSYLISYIAPCMMIATMFVSGEQSLSITLADAIEAFSLPIPLPFVIHSGLKRVYRAQTQSPRRTQAATLRMQILVHVGIVDWPRAISGIHLRSGTEGNSNLLTSCSDGDFQVPSQKKDSGEHGPGEKGLSFSRHLALGNHSRYRLALR